MNGIDFIKVQPISAMWFPTILRAGKERKILHTYEQIWSRAAASL
jgi:hypothetical protein